MRHDVIVVGTGPAGVSAARPLIDAGQEVLLVDPSVGEVTAPPAGEYLSMRRDGEDQAEWFVGNDFSALRSENAASPKLRVPRLQTVFEDFISANRIDTKGFTAVGSLASGGLSNAWGCGVARYDAEDLARFPLDACDLDESFAAVSRRMGLSGRSDDALTAYFGVDEWALDAPPLDKNSAALERRFKARSGGRSLRDLRLGRSRMAVLMAARADRQPCNSSGLCLWGCTRGALYSAQYDLSELKRRGAKHRTGILVERLYREGREWRVSGIDRSTGRPVTFGAARVVLAAGTIATTAIALRTLNITGVSKRLLSNPTAAFLLLRLASLGRSQQPGPAFAQLSFATQDADGRDEVHGSLFSASHIPAFEFIRHIPASTPAARALWQIIAPATLVGNAFLSPKLSAHCVMLGVDGVLTINGRHALEVDAALERLRRVWAKAARALGCILLPGSFMAGHPGADIHYAGTLPMRRAADLGETKPSGELVGADGVFIADASAFSDLSAKPHTLTMMALADRLGRHLARDRLSV